MVVAKRQRREKPMKIDQRKVLGPRVRTSGKTSVLGPVTPALGHSHDQQAGLQRAILASMGWCRPEELSAMMGCQAPVPSHSFTG